MDYNSWINSLREIIQTQDSPLILRNGHWEVADRKALLQNVGSRIFDVHLDQFKNCAIEVLKELNPQFELPAEERYAASIYRKVLNHSSNLRKGLAETLALLGSHGTLLKNCTPHKPESVAVLSIREIFDQANWQLWSSLNNLLPTLAEAAPSEFLNSIEKALQKQPCPFDELFAQEGKGIAGTNYMTGLLWALEVLSWAEEYFVRVSIILAELASHDPGGNWANRPANSLITILLPWYPQTLAPYDKRIAAIKAIKKDFPDVAWQILLSLLPNQHQTSFGVHKPRWRSVISDDWEPKVTNKEYRDQVTGYAELAVEMAYEDLDKLTKIVGNLDNLPNPSFDTILEYLSSAAIIGLPENQRLQIWTSLTEFAGKHRRHADAKWALDAKNIARIETTAKSLTPTSLEGLYYRLFSNRDFDLYEEKKNLKEQRKKLEQRRQHAIKEILNAKGINGVLSFIDDVESPSHVGWALGVIAENEIDPDLLPSFLDDENILHRQFANSYVMSRYHCQGWSWVDALDRSNWSLIQNCQLLMYLPFKDDTWRRASDWLGEYESTYWQKVPVNPYQSEGDLLFAVDKLLKAKRPQSAIECLNSILYKKMPFDNERAIKALLDAVTVSEPLSRDDTYNIVELIKALQNDPETNQNNLFKIEWAYLSLLDRPRGAEPKLLETRLATQPDFFCEVIGYAYRSKNEKEEDEKPDEQRKAIATNAWRLLHDWKRPPGLQEDGTFSEEKFKLWLRSVKIQCKQSGHLEVAMITIGEVLLYCPADPQGLWIVHAAANALNARDAEEMRNGFCTQIYNSRGVHRIDPTGKPERELATKWREKADAVENEGFARFAATLRELATSYDREAERITEKLQLDGE